MKNLEVSFLRRSKINIFVSLIAFVFPLYAYSSLPQMGSEKLNKSFVIFYSPGNLSKCRPYFNQYLFKNEKGYYQFKIMLNKNNFPLEFFEDHKINDLEFQIQSFSNQEVEKGPVYKISFKKLIQQGKCEDEKCLLVSYEFSLPVPRKLRKIKRTEADINANPWDITAILFEQSSKITISQSTYPVNLLSHNTTMAIQRTESSKFYALDGLPDSELYDNFNSQYPMNIEYDFSTSKLSQNLFGRSIWAFPGLITSSASTLGVIIANGGGTNWPGPVDLLGLFQGTGILGGVTPEAFLFAIMPIPVLHAPVGYFYVSYLKYNTNENIMTLTTQQNFTHNFTLAPGEAGIIYSQIQIEEKTFDELGEDQCGFLSKRGERKIKVHDINFSLINIDRKRIYEVGYLESLGKKFLPSYGLEQN